MLNCLISTIRRDVRLARGFDGNVVVAGNLFKGDSSPKIDQLVDPANKYTQECRRLWAKFIPAKFFEQGG
jgi:hypothetical protein